LDCITSGGGRNYERQTETASIIVWLLTPKQFTTKAYAASAQPKHSTAVGGTQAPSVKSKHSTAIGDTQALSVESKHYTAVGGFQAEGGKDVQAFQAGS